MPHAIDTVTSRLRLISPGKRRDIAIHSLSYITAVSAAMATGGVYKLDDGEACLNNCFPVRSFFQPSREGIDTYLNSN